MFGSTQFRLVLFLHFMVFTVKRWKIIFIILNDCLNVAKESQTTFVIIILYYEGTLSYLVTSVNIFNVLCRLKKSLCCLFTRTNVVG